MPPAEPGDLDEDSLVIDAFREMAVTRKRLLLILAPRRPGRFDSAAEKLTAAGVRFLRRSELQGDEDLPLPGVLLLDSIGELGGLFPKADVVFMGGTFPHRGGHNILEPAFSSKAVVAGPHMENFADIAADFRDGGGMVSLDDPGALAGEIAALLDDPDRRNALGARARQIAESKRGATDRALVEIRRLSGESIIRPSRSAVSALALRPLSWAWEYGCVLKRTYLTAKARGLATPVISIGGIGMGGAGKTPFVLYLVELLVRQGLKPAVLTRGYRRRSSEAAVILPTGSDAPVSMTGDEPQIFLRSGLAHVGIGSNRRQAGALIEKQLRPDLMILDDGFQHWALERDLDLVLIDALDPFAGGAVFPLGRLREPLEELRRADAFVITKVSPSAPLAAIERELRRHSDRPQIFHCRFEPVGWIDAASGEAVELGAGNRCGAFCGLANPASFWQSLDELGCRPVWRRAFGDHHRYRGAGLRRIASEARSAKIETLLTTQKDILNLPADWAEHLSSLRLLWLRIEPRMAGAGALMELVLSRLAAGMDARSRQRG